MKQTVVLITFLLMLTSCERDCEAFDLTRDIVKWHLFPERLQEYTFESDSLSKTLAEINYRISEFETIKCMDDCDCTRLLVSTYGDESNRFQSIIAYDQDDDYYTQPISYEIDYMELEFDISASGNIVGIDADSVPFNDYIDYEYLDTLTLGDSLYQDVLHVIVPAEQGVTDMWVAKSAGMVAFQEDSVRYIRKR